MLRRRVGGILSALSLATAAGCNAYARADLDAGRDGGHGDEEATPDVAATAYDAAPDDVQLVDDSSVEMPDPGPTDAGAPAVPETPASCGGARPTWLGGSIVGSDGRALNALIGVDHSINNVRVDADGRPCTQAGSRCCGGYSWCDAPNPTLSADGSTDPAARRAWGRCVAAGVTMAFIEVYPKGAGGQTDYARYGSAAHHYQPVTPGSRNDVLLRLPLIRDLGGNTGGVQGYVTCGGRPAPPDTVTRVRAWSNGRGPECGIEGFAAHADVLATGATGATYYRISYLEGGRCGAASQSYRLYMDVRCGGAVRSMRRDLDLVAGARPRVDWAF